MTKNYRHSFNMIYTVTNGAQVYSNYLNQKVGLVLQSKTTNYTLLEAVTIFDLYVHSKSIGLLQILCLKLIFLIWTIAEISLEWFWGLMAVSMLVVELINLVQSFLVVKDTIRPNLNGKSYLVWISQEGLLFLPRCLMVYMRLEDMMATNI